MENKIKKHIIPLKNKDRTIIEHSLRETVKKAQEKIVDPFKSTVLTYDKVLNSINCDTNFISNALVKNSDFASGVFKSGLLKTQIGIFKDNLKKQKQQKQQETETYKNFLNNVLSGAKKYKSDYRRTKEGYVNYALEQDKRTDINELQKRENAEKTFDRSDSAKWYLKKTDSLLKSLFTSEKTNEISRNKNSTEKNVSESTKTTSLSKNNSNPLLSPKIVIEKPNKISMNKNSINFDSETILEEDYKKEVKDSYDKNASNINSTFKLTKNLLKLIKKNSVSLESPISSLRYIEQDTTDDRSRNKNSINTGETSWDFITSTPFIKKEPTKKYIETTTLQQQNKNQNTSNKIKHNKNKTKKATKKITTKMRSTIDNSFRHSNKEIKNAVKQMNKRRLKYLNEQKNKQIELNYKLGNNHYSDKANYYYGQPKDLKKLEAKQKRERAVYFSNFYGKCEQNIGGKIVKCNRWPLVHGKISLKSRCPNIK